MLESEADRLRRAIADLGRLARGATTNQPEAVVLYDPEALVEWCRAVLMNDATHDPRLKERLQGHADRLRSGVTLSIASISRDRVQ